MTQEHQGLQTPWPDPRVWSVTRRLLASWRWEAERGPDSIAAQNARASVEHRVEGLGVDEQGVRHMRVHIFEDDQ